MGQLLPGRHVLPRQNAPGTRGFCDHPLQFSPKPAVSGLQDQPLQRVGMDVWAAAKYVGIGALMLLFAPPPISTNCPVAPSSAWMINSSRCRTVSGFELGSGNIIAPPRVSISAILLVFCRTSRTVPRLSAGRSWRLTVPGRPIAA